MTPEDFLGEVRQLTRDLLDLLMDDVSCDAGTIAAARAMVRVALWTDDPEQRAIVRASLLELVGKEFDAYRPIVRRAADGGEFISEKERGSCTWGIHPYRGACWQMQRDRKPCALCLSCALALETVVLTPRK